MWRWHKLLWAWARGVCVVGAPLLGACFGLMWLGLAPALAQSGSDSGLLLPAALAYDASGNLYIADKQRNQVLEATLGGSLVVVAGTGVQGFAGDGGPAAQAELNAPQGLAFGQDGTLYVADTGNRRVRAIAGGLVTTVVGDGTSTALRSPTALAVDQTGELVICDTGDHRIRRWSQGALTTVAGTGVQGFVGEGAAATAAELDAPAGLAVAADGRIFIADTHNNRVRMVGADGTIATYAGTGVRASTGDGGPALQAGFAGPRGLAVMPDGSLLVADGDGQRVRQISVAGVVSTVTGSGIEGVSSEGATGAQGALHLPRAVAVSSFGQVVTADSLNGTVRVLLASGQQYQPAALMPARTSAVQSDWASTQIYGKSSGSVLVNGGAGPPLGTVTLSEGDSALATVPVLGGNAEVTLPMLSAGQHSLLATYSGDGVNPAVTGAATSMQITPAPLVATANAVSMSFGAVLPGITGALSGVLPQDQGQVAVAFGLPSAPDATGDYTLVPVLTGARSGNYTVTLGTGSGGLQVTPAGTSTTLDQVQQGYAGVPLQLSARVTAGASGNPTGAVQFLDGSEVVATGTVVNGSAAGVYTPLAAGSRQITAVYRGNGNYQGSTSAVQVAVVGTLPDFTVTAPNATASVSAGGLASYALTVAAVPGPFTGIVVLSAAGQPAGSTVVFSPVQVVPGAGSALVTATVQTSAPVARVDARQSNSVQWAWVGGGVFCLLGCWPGRRRRWKLASSFCLGLTLLGCGARTVGEGVNGATSQTYTLQITGTATNLAGAVVSHTAPVTLVIQE